MRIALAFVTALLFLAGYFWHRAELQAADRAAWLSDPISEDADTSVGLTATGLFNRDVRVTAYTFTELNQSVADHWTDEIAHGKLAADFYHRGFRRVMTGNDSNTVIGIAHY